MTLSPIDNSLYAGLIDNIGTFPTSGSLSQTVSPAYTEAQETSEGVDLGDYYANQGTADLFTEIANNVAKAAKALDNAMVDALENGLRIEDAININCALHAYKANCYVAQSTFELKI